MTIFDEQLKQIGILPVVIANTVKDALSLAETLAENNIPCIEITCRTACAIDAIKAIKDSRINILLGVGTVTNTKLLEQISSIGVDFAVSPGVTASLIDASIDNGLPLLPGISSASEIMLCMEHGLKHMKIFPAMPIGASQLLKAFYSPFPEAQFCPTGGINMDNFQEFIKMPNVFCVGGSWVVPEKLVGNHEWNAIAKLCKESLALIHSP